MGIVIVSSHEKRTNTKKPFVRRHSIRPYLRFVPSETTVAMIGLVILACLSKREIESTEMIVPLPSGWVLRLISPFFRFASFGILTIAGSIIAILAVSALKVSASRHDLFQNLVRFYLIVMFLMILVDLIAHAAMGYMIFRAYYRG